MPELMTVATKVVPSWVISFWTSEYNQKYFVYKIKVPEIEIKAAPRYKYRVGTKVKLSLLWKTNYLMTK